MFTLAAAMPSLRPTLLAVALLTVALAAPARADEACIPEAAAAALADCSHAASLPLVSPADLLKAGRAAPPPAGGLIRPQKRAPSLDPRPFDPAETTLAGAFQRFACEDAPAATDAAGRERHASVALERGRLYFDAHQLAEAGAVFREVAVGAAETPAGVIAMQLYLESLDTRGTRGVAACYEDMTRDVPTFLGLYCDGGRNQAHPEACSLLLRIQRDLDRLVAERDVRAADRARREQGLDLYRAAGERYLAIFRRHGEEACARKQPGCERMDEILYNAAKAFQAGGDIPRAIAVRQVLIDPKHNLHGTELARKAVYEIAGSYQALGEYEEAAAWYERYAAASPKSAKAPEALSDAVVLRLGLGQDDHAVEDAEIFSKLFGASKPAEAATIAFAVAAHFVEKERWSEARKRLTAGLGQIDRSGALDVRIQAHALLGRVIEKLDGPAKATVEYEAVRSLWKDPAAVVRRIQSETGDDRRLGKALTALGEARFFFAEEKRKVAEAIRLPAYAGAASREDITGHLARKLGPAMAARRRAVEEAERAYQAVLEIQPAPPPRRVIASAARVARMHGRLAAEIRALPAPKAWKGEIRAAFRDALIEASEPDHRRAYAAARRCLDLSARFQWLHESARSCAAWMERHHPREHPRLDEIMPAPRLLAAGLDPRGAPDPDPRAP